MRLRDWLDKGTAQLGAGPHPERARLDAEMLLLHLIGKNRAWLITHGEDEFGGCRAIGYAALLDRRERGEPIQYIVGECEFYGLPFRVVPDVLIPRPETEHLVEVAIARAQAFEHPRILDIGTGSGAISVALAHALPQAQVTAVDLSPAALAIAQENAARNGVAGRMRFLHSDLLQAVAQEQFEIVVSNPPYVPELDRASLAIEVREHEPEMALFAGEDGVAIYRRLIPQAYSVLVPKGSIALEIGFGQSEAVSSLLTEAGFTHLEVTPDLQGIPRVLSARHS